MSQELLTWLSNTAAMYRKVGGTLHCTRYEQKKPSWTTLRLKRDPHSATTTHCLCEGKQWGSLSLFFHVLTTHPQKDTLLRLALVIYNDLSKIITSLLVVARVASVPHGHLERFLVDVQGFTSLRYFWLGIHLCS